MRILISALLAATLLCLSPASSANADAVSFTTDLGAGTITDDATGLVFATISATGSVTGNTADGISLNATPNSGTGTASYSIGITDSDYTLTGVEWNSRGGTPVILGGTPVGTTVGIRIDTAGTLTTGIQDWTLAGTAITNGTGHAYSSNQQFRHDEGGTITSADHWNLVAAIPSTSGTITYQKFGAGSAASEVATVAFEFCSVPEPGSLSLIASLACISLFRRRRAS